MNKVWLNEIIEISRYLIYFKLLPWRLELEQVNEAYLRIVVTLKIAGEENKLWGILVVLTQIRRGQERMIPPNFS